ncbi:MAG: hypothetical protein EYC69_04975 [Bacteroidetes bacterium]|nr:MAG: hypothetical protein EYC69_04975 [Bacteroidota bacterium]
MKNIYFAKNKIFWLLSIAFLFVACTHSPKPIEIGKDLCELCKMTIMDKRFGAELITSKGKIFKFDSIECLIGHVQKFPLDQYPVKALLVIDHNAPGEFIEAEKAFYLHSEKLPSPMGGNLTAVQNKKTIDEYIANYGGEIWTWDEAFRQLQ